MDTLFYRKLADSSLREQLEVMRVHATHEYEQNAITDALCLEQMWTVLLSTARQAGHQPSPEESELDFLARLVRRPVREHSGAGLICDDCVNSR